MYFVQISNFQYLKIKEGNTDIDVQVWWAQGKNNEVLKYSMLDKKGYKYVQSLYPGQHVNITLFSEGYGMCKVIGFSSGMFEVGSILGDQIDLIESGITKKFKKQVQLTISTIKEIAPISIDILGNIQ